MRCAVCGGTGFARRPVLWPRLVQEWGLDPDEVDYIDRQQGEHCVACGANLRSIVLAEAILHALGSQGVLLLVATEERLRWLRILEVNPAGMLTSALRGFPGHVLVEHPEVDIHALPFADGSFDIVVHSDTLEHVADPVLGLRECRRVLTDPGVLCYTIPMVVGRMTRSRDGLPPSYHGSPDERSSDWAVRTEFGADAWTYPVQAGFGSVGLHSLDFPAAVAFSAWNGAPAVLR